MNPFKMYDIRGIYPQEVDENLAYELGKAVSVFLKAKKLVVGRDGRASSDVLYKKLVEGITLMGCDVVNIGRCSTPQFYFELFRGTADGGIMITASHNPKEYNGFKICGPNARPIYAENGFDEIQELIKKSKYDEVFRKGEILNKQIFEDYVTYFSSKSVEIKKPLKIIIDTGNGMGICEVKALKKIMGSSIDETVLFPVIDGNFPNHECNPIKKDNVKELLEEMKKNRYDLGFAFDGDADRVVCFTSSGLMIPPDIMTAILAKVVCKEGDKVGFEVRTSQSVVEELNDDGFKGQLYPSGHSLIKKHMVKDGTVFAGEKSGHYFYRDLSFTESSLYTVINIIKFYLENDLEKVAKKIINRRYSIEEKNYVVSDKEKALEVIEKSFEGEKVNVDGLSIYTEDYFFNIRKSNTENLIRLNVEGANDTIVNEVVKKIETILARI